MFKSRQHDLDRSDKDRR